MTLKTPSFWYRGAQQTPQVAEILLTPFSKLYGLGYSIHRKLKTPYKANIPVICIGNISAGGTGKTPTAIALLKTVKASGLAKNPFFLIRGYGGAEKGPMSVNLGKHTAWDVGDEALILAKHAPTVVGGDRAASAKHAENEGADMLILDDGLQNPGIFKDLSLVVINGEMGFGNLKPLPAGPLRQPLDEGLKLADAFIIIGDDQRNVGDLLPKDKPVLHANLCPGADGTFDKTKPYMAFAGLGYPAKFFKFIREKLGLNLIETIAFSDHHPYIEDDIRRLKTKAQDLGATLITTEKDFLRIPLSENDDIEIVPVDMRFKDEDTLTALIKETIKARK